MAALNLLVRPVLIISLEGSYASYDGFYDSLYWTTSMLCHAVVSLLIAFTLLASAALDMMRDLRAETNTDPLSGLLNRRGFERAATEALCAARRDKASRPRWSSPTSIISRPSTTASAMPSATRSSSPSPSSCARPPLQGAIMGRLGGEEFVVLLTASDLAAARLFAEGVQAIVLQRVAARRARPVKVTASFGVASLSGTEGLSELLGRADSALYNAKKAGRDRVRLSYQHVASRCSRRPRWWAEGRGLAAASLSGATTPSSSSGLTRGPMPERPGRLPTVRHDRIAEHGGSDLFLRAGSCPPGSGMDPRVCAVASLLLRQDDEGR